MNTRNRIILIVVLVADACIFSFGLYQKNLSESAAHDALVYKTIQAKTIERQSDLLIEVRAVEDSLKKCCNR